jgi:hypothetical protein
LGLSADVARIFYSCNPTRSNLVKSWHFFPFFPFTIEEMISLWGAHLELKQKQIYELSQTLGGNCFLLFVPTLPTDLAYFYTRRLLAGYLFKSDGSCSATTTTTTTNLSSALSYSFTSSTASLASCQSLNHLNQAQCFRHFDAVMISFTRNENVKKYLSGLGTALVIGFSEHDSNLFCTCHDSRYSMKAVGMTTTSTRTCFESVSLRSTTPLV